MSGKPRSVRQAQAQLSAQLRGMGRSWAEIAAVFQERYRVNPRVALRQAHGWSQPQAAARWTARWPDDPKTFKSFSYWEQWPGRTGHAPSLDTLDRLAQLYECRITDLLADCRDYGGPGGEPGPGAPAARGDEPAPAAVAAPAGLPGPAAGGAERPLSAEVLRAALETIRQAQAAEAEAARAAAAAPPAARAAAPGAGGPEEQISRLRRRTLLLEASSALAVLAAAPVLEVPRLVTGTRPGRPPVDLSVVNYTGEVVAGLRRLGGAVGPRITLPPAMALRSAMAALARSAPEVVTSQALTAYGDLTQLIGWLMFNLGDHKSALYYYDDARAAAHRAGSHDLVAYALAATGHLEIHRRRPRHAIDHAQAAWQAAKASGSPYALAYAADVTARAYAAAGQVSRCHAALDRERDALLRIGAGTPRAPWWYFYDESFYWGTESECALKLDMPVEACDAARQALGLVEPHNLHNSALTLAFRAEALIRQGEVEEACRSIADAARYTTMNSSKRISRRIEHLRRQLRGAEGSAAVRELDDKLAEYRRARAAAGVPPGLPGWGRVP